MRYLSHIIHRCHKKKFLLKFDKDKRRWRYCKIVWSDRMKISRQELTFQLKISFNPNAQAPWPKPEVLQDLDRTEADLPLLFDCGE